MQRDDKTLAPRIFPEPRRPPLAPMASPPAAAQGARQGKQALQALCAERDALVV